MFKRKIINKDRFLHHLECAKEMPIISGGAKEVVKWLVEQPAIKHYVMAMVSAIPNPLIRYDIKNGTWKGIDYDEKLINLNMKNRK